MVLAERLAEPRGTVFWRGDGAVPRRPARVAAVCTRMRERCGWIEIGSLNRRILAPVASLAASSADCCAEDIDVDRRDPWTAECVELRQGQRRRRLLSILAGRTGD